MNINDREELFTYVPRLRMSVRIRSNNTSDGLRRSYRLRIVLRTLRIRQEFRQRDKFPDVFLYHGHFVNDTLRDDII